MRSMREAIYVRKIKEPTIAISDNEEVMIYETKEEPVVQFDCLFCGKSFHSKLQLDNHVSSCEVKLKQDLIKAVKFQNEKEEMEKIMKNQNDQQDMEKLIDMLNEKQDSVKNEKHETDKHEKIEQIKETTPKQPTEKKSEDKNQNKDKNELPQKTRMRLNTLPVASPPATPPQILPTKPSQPSSNLKSSSSNSKSPTTEASQSSLPPPIMLPVIEKKSAAVVEILVQPPPQSRPIRNRIKKNHKDFIYDLPTIASITSLNPMKPSRRRNTIQDPGPVAKKQAIEVMSISQTLPTKSPFKSSSSKYVKAAFRMANLVVDRARAQFRTPPRLKSQNNILAILPLARRQSVRNLNQDESMDSSFMSVDLSAELGSPTHNNSSSSCESSFIAKVSTDKDFKQYFEKNRLSEPIKKILVVTHDVTATATAASASSK